MRPISKIKYVILDIKHGIKNLIVYFPLIWNTREWDYVFLYKMLRFKLYNMHLFFNKANIYDNREITEQINECVVLLDDLIDRNYENQVMDDFYKKWGDPEIITTKYDDDYTLVDIKHPNAKTHRDEERCNKELMECQDRVSKHYDAVIEKLFTILKEKSIHWWN